MTWFGGLAKAARTAPNKGHSARQGRFYASGDLAHMENPLETFQKFDLAGHGLKGQTNSGFSQSGLGLDVNVGVDLGTFVCPWLVRIPFTLSGGGKAADHVEMVLTRFPMRIWRHRLHTVAEQRRWPHRPVWSTQMPLVLSSMRGVRWEGSIGSSIGAQAGVGNVLGRDEVRFAATAQVEVSGSGTISTTNLKDHHPLRFRSAYPADTIRAGHRRTVRTTHAVADDWSNNMAAYIDAELLGDVKARIILWIEHKIDVDLTSKLIRSGNFTTERAREILDEWAAAQQPMPEWDLDPTGGLATLMAALHRKPSTVELIGHLATLETTLQQTVTKSKDGTDLTGAQEAALDALMETDRQMIRQLQATLRSRQLDKRAGTDSLPERRHPEPIEPGPTGAVSRLRIGSRIVTMRADAGAGLVLVAGVTARFSKEMEGKDVSFRYQAVSRRSASSAMVHTQDTVLRQNLYTVEDIRRPYVLKAGPVVDRGSVYGTVTYTSACAYWIDGRHDVAQALPNGTGVSFGMSARSDALFDYASWCLHGDDITFEESIEATEKMLLATVPVERDQLRAFFAGCPIDAIKGIASSTELADTSLIVEVGYATREPEPLPFETAFDRREPQELLTLAWAQQRIDDRRSASARTRLSVMRLRYRKRRTVDSTRPLLTFGWGPETGPSGQTVQSTMLKNPFETFSSPIGVGGGPTRVERVGAEGIVDLHTSFFPSEPDDGALADAYELAVPAVALFSQ